jgi:peptidase M1-like protein
MNRLLFLLIGFVFMQLSPVFGQNLFTTTNVQTAYKKETRTMTGEPGKKYWQNRGDYDIKVNFDPTTNLLSGEETIQYLNNSPDSLKHLIIRLYPDLYKKGVDRLKVFGDIKDKDLNDGVSVDQLIIGDETITDFTDPKKAYHINTNLIVTPDKPVLPKSELTLIVKWHYTVNTGSQIRTGMVDSGSYFIAYFFPRIAVYDDIDGWDTWSYNSVQEFYNDFGDFNVEINVPKNEVVWATGERQNAADNFGSTVLDRLQRASVSENIVHVIDSTDYGKKNVFSSNPTGQWKFKATNVTDFAFAISDHYLWDASSVLVDSASNRRTLASAAYNKIHTDYFDVAHQAHESVYYMSHFYPNVPFPFPQITVFDGTDQMEYPMIINDNPTPTHNAAVQLTSHEIFHSYFPFYMGINETQYAWMDEGWATIGESMISPKMGEPEEDGIYSKSRYERISGTDRYVPLITNSKLYQDEAYLANSYGKAGICYWVLQDMLGDSLYFKALHSYIDNWHGKHPTPYDFFYSFNNATGMDLNWFWEKWFYEFAYPDLAITDVQAHTHAPSTIVITNKGGLPLPVDLTIKLFDGTTKHLHYSADVWNEVGSRLLIVKDMGARNKIKSIILGNNMTPDNSRDDNSWKMR